MRSNDVRYDIRYGLYSGIQFHYLHPAFYILYWNVDLIYIQYNILMAW